MAKDGMAVIQKSKPLVTRAGAWHTWSDRLHLKAGQEKLPLQLTFANGVDGRPNATDLIVELERKPLATFKDFNGGNSFTIDLTGKLHAGNSSLTVKGFGPSGARMKWKLLAERPIVTSVNPQTIGLTDTITIDGSNFSDDRDRVDVQIGNKHTKPLECKPSQIKCKLPAHVDGGNQDLTVSVSSIPSTPMQVSVRSNPRITWVDMLASPPQHPVTVNGSGFSPAASENIVTVGNVRANVQAATASSITFIIPNMHFPRWHAPIKVITNGMPSKDHVHIHVDARVVPNEGIPMH